MTSIPGVVQDPRNGQLYLFWAQQREQIWEGALSPDGFTLAPEHPRGHRGHGALGVRPVQPEGARSRDPSPSTTRARST